MPEWTDLLDELRDTEIRHLLLAIEHMQDTITDSKTRLHDLNERLLATQTNIELLKARARRND